MMKFKLFFMRLVLVVLCLTAFACQPRRGIVVSKIKAAAKLATTKTTVNKIVFGEVKNQILFRTITLSTARFAATTKAIITSGINLDELAPEDIRIDGKKIEVRLPGVIIINFSYPFESFVIDNTITDDAFLNKIDIYKQEDFYRLAELDIRKQMEHTGIRESTEQKTRVMLESLLKNLGYEEIYITFRRDNQLFEESGMTGDE